MKFNIGDYIIGNSFNEYGYTNKENICRVIGHGIEDSNPGTFLHVKVVYSPTKDISRHTFRVKDSHFRKMSLEEVREKAGDDYLVVLLR